MSNPRFSTNLVERARAAAAHLRDNSGQSQCAENIPALLDEVAAEIEALEHRVYIEGRAVEAYRRLDMERTA